MASPNRIDDPVVPPRQTDEGGALWHELQALRRSEAVLRDFIETSTIALHWVGADGTILWANQAELDLVGYARDEYIGRNIAEFHADEPVIRDILGCLSRGDTLRDYPARLRHRNGSIRHVLINSSVLFEDGKFIHTRCFTRDVTRLREEQQRGRLLTAIVESSGDAIYIYDVEGTILTWNRAAEELYGYSERDMLGRNVRQIIPPDYTAEISDLTRAAVSEGKIITNLESKRLRRDGCIFPARLTISPVRDECGNAVGVSVIARDISDQKRSEESLRETQKLESLGLLAGGIAHDFNNLLTGVIGNASLLLDEFRTGSAQSEAVQNLMHAAERMARLTSQMLAYSGRGHFVIEPMDLSKQVMQITSLIQASIPKNVELRLSLANNLPLVQVDVSQLQQIIMNLVINAADSIGNGQGTVEVRTELEIIGEEHRKANLARTMPQSGEYVAITVEDTGCGMDESTRNRIFDPFFTTKFTGRGLGLSSVLGIVRGHRGLITVDTYPGAGTKFRVFFPVSRAVARTEASPTHDVRGKDTVLVVDDEEVARTMTKAALQRLGFNVITAMDGSDALRIYAEQHRGIDLVLLDMTMPVMGGEETLRRLLEIRSDVAVIAMSGFHERKAKQRFGSGIIGFLQKPFTVGQLGSKISSARRDRAAS